MATELTRDDQSRPGGQVGLRRTALPRLERRWLLLALAALLLLMAGGLVGRWSVPTMPGDDSVAAGFARDMSAHHTQAVTMALTAYNRTQSADIRTLALDIMLGQQAQIGMMTGWLDSWGLPQTGAKPPLAWMGGAAAVPTLTAMAGMDETTPAATAMAGMGGEAAMAGPMPGMATAAEVASLSTLPPDQMDVTFLRLMIRHHQAGVAMARAALARTDRPEVRSLAQSIVTGQQAEMQAMQDMLAKRGASA